MATNFEWVKPGFVMSSTYERLTSCHNFSLMPWNENLEETCLTLAQLGSTKELMSHGTIFYSMRRESDKSKLPIFVLGGNGSESLFLRLLNRSQQQRELMTHTQWWLGQYSTKALASLLPCVTPPVPYFCSCKHVFVSDIVTWVLSLRKKIIQ